VTAAIAGCLRRQDPDLGAADPAADADRAAVVAAAPAGRLSATLRRGRYSGPTNVRPRAAIALGLFSSAVLILLMALLAGSAGLRVNG
jgi:hypothetical protein